MIIWMGLVVTRDAVITALTIAKVFDEPPVQFGELGFGALASHTINALFAIP